MYRIIEPPFTLKFREMSRQELNDYFEWFQIVRPQRIEELIQAVKESPGFEDWRADYSPGSLVRLGEWFAAQVETRPRTAEELEQVRRQQTFPIDVPGQELTNRTFSLAIDVGMYVSGVFLRNHPGLRWTALFGNKQSIDYGQPVLVEFVNSPFNPVQMMVTQAYGLVDKTYKKGRLRELYDIWSKLVRQ
jgi:hypothetical protein